MSSFSENHVDSYEKKFSVYQLYRMYQEERLVFPDNPAIGRMKKIERISETLETILLGISLPLIYVSERQDGSLLVLESSDRLRYFMDFLDGRYPVEGLEFYPELNGYELPELEQQFPRITSFLLDYRITLQIIEYTTPKYMHMQVGNYIERWSFTREQGVRNKLYGREMEKLWYLEENLGRSHYFLGKRKLYRQHMVLRILMYHFVLKGNISERPEEGTGIQQMLDQTVKRLNQQDNQWIINAANSLRKATNELESWGKSIKFGLGERRGREWQARMLGYLYHAVWSCWEKGYEIPKGLVQITNDGQFWSEIERNRVTPLNIRRHYSEIEKRLC